MLQHAFGIECVRSEEILNGCFESLFFFILFKFIICRNCICLFFLFQFFFKCQICGLPSHTQRNGYSVFFSLLTFFLLLLLLRSSYLVVCYLLIFGECFCFLSLCRLFLRNIFTPGQTRKSGIKVVGFSTVYTVCVREST